jgi:transposase InsO family protein
MCAPDSIKCPDALPVDLTQVIPEELTASGISDESGMMMTHQTILGVLFRPLVDPAYPLAVAERSLLLMRTLLGTFAATPYLNRLSEFWLATLQDALCRLGLRPQHLYFGSYPPEGQSSPPFAFGLNDSIERIRLLLRLFIILSSTSYLNDRGYACPLCSLVSVIVLKQGRDN